MPEEALRDQIIQQARNCANYTTDGYCAMNGRFCSPLTDRYAIRAGGIDCDHYFTHVLPLDSELHKAVMRELEQEPGEEHIHARTEAQKARGSPRKQRHSLPRKTLEHHPRRDHSAFARTHERAGKATLRFPAGEHFLRADEQDLPV